VLGLVPDGPPTLSPAPRALAATARHPTASLDRSKGRLKSHTRARDFVGEFAREILPGLADVPPAAIARATGLSGG
jgi:hypothetical protein